MSAKVPKEMKFVKAKEPVVETSVVEKVKPEKKRNVTNQRFFTKPPNQSVVKPKAQGKSLPVTKRSENSTFLPSLWNSRTYQTELS